MTHHATTTRGDKLSLGAAFCIKANHLEVGDVLDVTAADGANVQARIELFDRAHLRIQAGQDPLYLPSVADRRPALVARAGTTSCWTIQQLAMPGMV